MAAPTVKPPSFTLASMLQQQTLSEQRELSWCERRRRCHVSASQWTTTWSTSQTLVKY